MKYTTVFFALCASLFANDMCASLCPSCPANSTDPTCTRVDSLCRCSDLLNKQSQMETAKALKKELAISRILTAFEKGCHEEFCTFLFIFEGDSLSKIKKTKTPLTEKELQAFRVSTDSLSAKADEPLLTLSDECQNFCAICPEEKSGDSTCARIENICGCNVFAKQQAKLAVQAEADSIQKIQAFLHNHENRNASAASIYSYHAQNAAENFSVTLRKIDYRIIEIRKREELSPAQNDAIITFQKDSSGFSDSLKLVTHSNASDSAKTPSKTWRVFYPGIALYGGPISETGRGGYDWSTSMGLTAGLGAFMRIYFYKYGSFQVGANIVYQYEDNDIINADYYDFYKGYRRNFNAGINSHHITAEIPLELRIGFPTWQWLSPFFSYNFNIRKPLCLISEHYVEVDYNRKSYDWEPNGFESGDFDFMGFFGIGAEIFRHVSIEFQWLMHSISTYSEDTTEPYDSDDTYRLKLDFAF